MAIAYIVMVIAALAWLTYIDLFSLREAISICVLWPVVLALIILWLLISGSAWLLGLVCSLDNSQGQWGSRRLNDGPTGIAICCPWFEVHFMKQLEKQTTEEKL